MWKEANVLTIFQNLYHSMKFEMLSRLAILHVWITFIAFHFFFFFWLYREVRAYKWSLNCIRKLIWVSIVCEADSIAWRASCPKLNWNKWISEKFPVLTRVYFSITSNRFYQITGIFSTFQTKQLIFNYSEEKFESFCLMKTGTESYATFYPFS